MTCPRCEARGKTWSGSDPDCAFENGVFKTGNWNCATMNDLRARLAGADDIDNLVSSCDQHASIAPLADTGAFLLLSWYKRRGRTEGAWVICEDKMYPLTLDVADAFLSDDEVRLDDAITAMAYA